MADEKIYTNVGHATAYAYAKSKGYTGSEDQFATDQANFAANAQQVREDKESVEATVATFGNTTVPAAVQTVTAEGTRQVGIVGTAGDTQVARVQAEGTTQKNAVQAKGNEVIASIPSDYTELTEEVEDLKSSCNRLEEGVVDSLYKAKVEFLGIENKVAFFAKAGDSLTISSEQNEAFTPNTINFYDKDGIRVSFWTIINQASPKTITIPTGRNDIYSCALLGGTAQNITIINTASDAFKNAETISVNKEVYEQITKTLISQTSVVVPCYAQKDDEITVIALGDEFVGTTSSRIQFYDRNLNPVAFWGLGSSYGRQRKFTYSNNTPAYYASLNQEPGVVVLRSNDYQSEYSDSITAKYINTESFCDRKNVEQNSLKTFVFFSDIHGASVDMNRIVEFANNVGDVTAVINGGDTVQSFVTDNIDWYNTAIDGCTTDVIMAVGNHDVWTANYVMADQVTVYNKFIAPMISKVSGIVQPIDAASNGLCYFYKDYNDIRMIVLSAMTYSDSDMQWTAEQLAWFVSVLADAKNNNKSVICVNHAPFSKSTAVIDYTLPLNSWQKYQSWSSMDNISVNSQAVSAVNDFINNGGKFICWLAGHEHRDFIMTNSVFSGQFLIDIASEKYNLRHDGVNAASTDERNNDCLDYIGIDTTNSIIKVWRVGYQKEANLKLRNRFVYEYAKKKVIAYS